MYIFRLSSVLYIQKLSAGKEFGKRNNFIATQRKIQVSHLLVIVFQRVFVLLIFITMPVNPFSF